MTVNWGILGASNFAFEHMGPAIHAARGARLAGVASRSANKIDAFAEFAPDLMRFHIYDDLLASPEIEAVYIPLPNAMHVEWTLRALEAGKHVMCEKPLALRAGEIDALIAKRDATGLMAVEAYMIVHHPQWQRTRALVQAGGIGPLRQISCAFSFDNRDPENIRNKADQGGGALPDIGCYALGCARYVTGLEAEHISAQITWENRVDVLSRVQAQFGEAGYSGYVSTRMQLYQEVVFHGEAGLIKLSAPFNANVYNVAQLEIHSDGLHERTERFPTDNHYVHQVENFCRSLRDGAPYPWSLEDAKGTQALIDAVYSADKARNERTSADAGG